MRIAGRWRITEAELWDCDALNLVAPAFIEFAEDGSSGSLETLGIIPVGPLPCWGWGDIPDQYGRRWDGDDGSSRRMPKAPNGLADLPPILPGWGPRGGTARRVTR